MKRISGVAVLLALILFTSSISLGTEDAPHGYGIIQMGFERTPFKAKVPVGLAPPPARYDCRERGEVSPVKDQGSCGACYAFASLADFESKLLVAGEGLFDFSENNIKECQYYSGPPYYVSVCSGGAYWLAANYLSTAGTVWESCDPYQSSMTGCKSTCTYLKTLLDWRAISERWIADTDVLKAYIKAYGPIYVHVYAGVSGDPWQTEFQHYDGQYTLYYDGGATEPNHAGLIVGWDDDISHMGGQGAWIVKNSWGTEWGGPCGYGEEGGYYTIAYGSALIGWGASFLYEWQDYDPNGRLLYYDEGGYTKGAGFGSTTAWALCTFVPDEDIFLQRVEFWSFDPIADADAYIYDDFDGGTLSHLLTSHLDYTVDLMGYHSIKLAEQPLVRAGDSIYVAMKIAAESDTAPIPFDRYGPTTPHACYTSPDGSVWSEFTRGDIGIRLRGTKKTDTTPPSISISVFQNPYITNHLDVYLISSEALATSSVSVKVNSSPITMVANDVLKYVYRGDYDLCCTGPLPIEACARDLSYNDSCATRVLFSSLILASSGGTARSLDGRCEMRIPGGATRRDAYVLVSEVRTGSPGRGAVYEISPAGLDLSEFVEIGIGYADTTSEPEHLCIAKVTGEGVRQLESFVDRERQRIVAYADSLGSYELYESRDVLSSPLGSGSLILSQNYPNPFQGRTNISFQVPQAGHLTLYVVTVEGRIVTKLWEGDVTCGMHRQEWDGTDSRGKKVASGVYYLRVETIGGNATRKMVILN